MTLPALPLVDQIKARLLNLSETPALDAQVLLAHALGRSRAWALAHPEARLSPEQAAGLENWLLQMEAGAPLPYLLQSWEFYGMDIFLSPAVLIPRPETELLVEQALSWLQKNPGRRWALDVGTGSACIAVALAANLPDLRLLASDISAGALAQAGANLRRYALQERVQLLQADLLPATGKPFDLICANLPYIPTQELEKLKVGLWEPRVALDGGPDGLRWIRRFLQDAPQGLAPGGLLLMEIEAGQGRSAFDLACGAFPHAEIAVLPDLAGRDRLVRVQT